MSSEIAELTKTFNLFIQENTKVITRLEVNQEHLTNAVKEVTAASTAAITSNKDLEAKIVSLEDRAINKMNLVEDTVNENASKIDIMDKRVQRMELVSANESGKEAGKKETLEKVDKKATTNWTRTLGLLTLIVAVGGLWLKIILGE